MDHKINLIFLIDDDKSINYYHALIIEKSKLKMETMAFTDAREALNLIENARDDVDIPDLILLDLNMPRFDGWDFIEGFKKISHKLPKNIQIYIISNFLSDNDRLRAQDEEIVNGICYKPVSQYDFLEIANNYS